MELMPRRVEIRNVQKQKGIGNSTTLLGCGNRRGGVKSALSSGREEALAPD